MSALVGARAAAGVDAWVGACPVPARSGRERGKRALQPEPSSGCDVKRSKPDPVPFRKTFLPLREAPRLWESAVFLYAAQKGRL